MPDKSLETLAREWLMDDSEGHSKWKLQPHVDSLAALLRSRDERALRIVEAAAWPEACRNEILRRMGEKA